MTTAEMGIIENSSNRGGLTALMARKFNLSPKVFTETIKKTVMPKNTSEEELVAFLMVAHEYGLNPILREIHAFPKKGGGIQTIVGVDGWAKLVCTNNDFDGMDFEYEMDEKNKPISVTCTIYRKSTERPVAVTEYFEECFRNTDPWKQMPRRMLRHKALMQCGRIALGLSGITDEDEGNDIREVHATVLAEPSPKAIAVKDAIEKKRGKAKPSAKESKAVNEPDEASAPEDGEGSDDLAYIKSCVKVWSEQVTLCIRGIGFSTLSEIENRPEQLAEVAKSLRELLPE